MTQNQVALYLPYYSLLLLLCTLLNYLDSYFFRQFVLQ
jgi:hypothetical protein